MNERNEQLAQRLTALEDIEALRVLKARYAALADKCLSTPSPEHALALAALFADDAMADYGFFGRFQGRAQLLHAFENVLPAGTRWSVHYMANPAIEVDGSRAKGTWTFLIYAVPRDAPPGPLQNFFGTYEETYVKTESGWKFASLIVHYALPPA